MKKFLLPVLVALFLLTQSTVLVAALTLNNIGTSTVTGTISTWSYTGRNPALSGTATPSETVTVNVQNTNHSVTADTGGNWSYIPTDLITDGAHPISITSGGQTISFTLNLTNAAGLTATSSGTTTTTSTISGQPVLPNELPQTGAAQETMLLLAGGLGLISGGLFFYWKVVPKLLIEEPATEVESIDNQVQ